MRNFAIVKYLKNLTIAVTCCALTSCVKPTYKVPITPTDYNYYGKDYNNVIDAIKYCKHSQPHLSDIASVVPYDINHANFYLGSIYYKYIKKKDDIDITLKYRSLIENQDNNMILQSKLIYPITVPASPAKQFFGTIAITGIVLIAVPLMLMYGPSTSTTPVEPNHKTISDYILECSLIYYRTTQYDNVIKLKIKSITEHPDIANELINKYNLEVDVENNSNYYKATIASFLELYNNYCIKDYPDSNKLGFDNCPVYREIYSKEVTLEENIQDFLNKAKEELLIIKNKLRGCKNKTLCQQQITELNQDIIIYNEAEKELKYLKFIQSSKYWQLFRTNYLTLFCKNSNIAKTNKIYFDYICNKKN